MTPSERDIFIRFNEVRGSVVQLFATLRVGSRRYCFVTRDTFHVPRDEVLSCLPDCKRDRIVCV